MTAEGQRALARRAHGKENSSIRLTTWLLVLETAIALYLLLVSVFFGEHPESWMLAGLSLIALVSFLTGIGLFSFKRRPWARHFARTVAFLFLPPVAILVIATLPLMAVGVYYLGVAFVVMCLVLGLSIWFRNVMRAVRKKKTNS